jgi:hypothetical protein
VRLGDTFTRAVSTDGVEQMALDQNQDIGVQDKLTPIIQGEVAQTEVDAERLLPALTERTPKGHAAVYSWVFRNHQTTEHSMLQGCKASEEHRVSSPGWLICLNEREYAVLASTFTRERLGQEEHRNP